jgi:hypothetical protein
VLSLSLDGYDACCSRCAKSGDIPRHGSDDEERRESAVGGQRQIHDLDL